MLVGSRFMDTGLVWLFANLIHKHARKLENSVSLMFHQVKNQTLLDISSKVTFFKPQISMNSISRGESVNVL